MSKAQIEKSSEPVTPMKFMNDLWAARVSLTLMAAIELDVFTTIAQVKKTVADIAKALKAPKRGVERLLDALVGIGYLRKRDSQLGLTPVADMFLVRTKPSYIGAMADESRITLTGWIQLAEVVRSGKPIAGVDTADGGEFFPRLVKAIFPMTYNAARDHHGCHPPAGQRHVNGQLNELPHLDPPGRRRSSTVGEGSFINLPPHPSDTRDKPHPPLLSVISPLQA